MTSTNNPALTRFKILAIEDDPRIHMMYEKAFPSTIFDLTIKPNGQQGLDFHSNTPAELIVLDMLMPIMTGYSALKEIRKTIKDTKTPILMVTSKKSKEDIAMCSALGISGFIIKPFDVAALREKVINVLGAASPERASRLHDLYEKSIEIKSRVSILDVAKDLTSLSAHGNDEYIGDCPTKACKAKKGAPGTIVINQKRGEFYCKTCNSRGDLFKLIELALEKDAQQTLEHLQSRFSKEKTSTV